MMYFEKLRKAEEHRLAKSIPETDYTYYSVPYTHVSIQWIRAHFFMSKIYEHHGVTAKATGHLNEAKRRAGFIIMHLKL